MARRADFHPEAVEEAAAAAIWYFQRNPRAAREFADEIEAAIKRYVQPLNDMQLGLQAPGDFC